MQYYGLTVWGKIGFYIAVVTMGVLYAALIISDLVQYFNNADINYLVIFIRYFIVTSIALFVLRTPIQIVLNTDASTITLKGAIKTYSININSIKSIARIKNTTLPSLTQDIILLQWGNKHILMLIFSFMNIERLIENVFASNNRIKIV